MSSYKRKNMHRFTLIALLLTPVLSHAESAPDPRLKILKAMQTELQRSMEQLKLPEYEAPYFISYRLSEEDELEVRARFGAIVQDGRERHRKLAVDVRVGGYSFDSSAELDDDSYYEERGFQAPKRAPIDDDELVLRVGFWLLSDQAYKGALQSYLRKKARQVMSLKEKQVDSFSRAPSVQHQDPPLSLEADRERWRELARRLSLRFRQPGILEGSVRIAGSHSRLFLVNSEGSQMIRDELLYVLGFEVLGQAPDGMLLEQGETLYRRSFKEFPNEQELEALVDEAVEKLALLYKAPLADPYTGPAILEPEASGVFFHETLGHRLEGERQDDAREGQTFKGKLETQILPKFITLRDDPTLSSLNGVSLNGHYLYDDQAVIAQDTLLVDRGILKTFLSSRRPLEDLNGSNGHGRARGVHQPMARMGNLIVEGHQPVSQARLKEMLLEEARRQGKPYGLIIRDIIGGSTNTSTYGYQAFKGTPRMVYRVDVQTGEERLVRGVDMVGTPLTVMSKILATSDQQGIFNGFCGAESGYVPVSAVAPATLFQEIELQRSKEEKERAPVLPAPWP